MYQKIVDDRSGRWGFRGEWRNATMWRGSSEQQLCRRNGRLDRSTKPHMRTERAASEARQSSSISIAVVAAGPLHEDRQSRLDEGQGEPKCAAVGAATTMASAFGERTRISPTRASTVRRPTRRVLYPVDDEADVTERMHVRDLSMFLTHVARSDEANVQAYLSSICPLELVMADASTSLSPS